MPSGHDGIHDRYDDLTKIKETWHARSVRNITYEDAIEYIERIDDRPYRHLLNLYYIDALR